MDCRRQSLRFVFFAPANFLIFQFSGHLSILQKIFVAFVVPRAHCDRQAMSSIKLIQISFSPLHIGKFAFPFSEKASSHIPSTRVFRTNLQPGLDPGELLHQYGCIC